MPPGPDVRAAKLPSGRTAHPADEAARPVAKKRATLGSCAWQK
ncbi:hypothetical protein OG698_17415 [Streptomyces sp. NBC_01003]|nr:hypothetical protein OG698_17415 [Streptomyces sp. NBC_01003]